MGTTTTLPVAPKPKPRWLKITARILVVVFVLWLGFVGFMWRIMNRTPDQFARVMMHLPWEVFLICPFETMWTRARAGSVHVGDAAPVISARIVGILEEEVETGLAGRAGQRLFIAERTEETQAIAQAF